VIVKSSNPLKSCTAVNVIISSLTLACILFPSDILKLNVSSSISVAETVICIEVSSSKSTSGILDSTGASLIGLIVRVKLSVSVNCPSLTVTLIVTSPL